MQVTLTGSFNMRTIRKTTDGNCVYAGTNRIGYNSDGDHYMFCDPADGEVFDEDFRDTITGGKITLKLTAAFPNAIASDGYLQVRIYKQAVYDSDPQETLDRMMIYEADLITVPGTTTKWYGDKILEVEITGTARIRNILQYGFGLFAFGMQNLYVVSAATLELTGESTEPAPVLTLNTSSMAGSYTGGVYYHQAGDKAFRVAVQYSQELGVAMQYIRYTIKPDGGSAVSGQTTDLSLTVDKSLWAEIPAAGTVELTAVSAHGIPSAVLVLPWVITHYDIRVRTPVSGSILQTGEDVVLTWDLVLPDGMPSAPAPTRYTIWPAWDDDEAYQVAYAVTERTYTIPADSFAGHTKLKLLILDEYGSVVRRRGDGRLIMLYLQPSASMHGITVSKEFVAGMYTPVLTVTWDSSGQTAFHLKAGEFDSGAVWGVDTSYTIPKVFEDGVHEIRLRIQDANGRWGAWSEPIFANVANMENTARKAELTAKNTGNSVKLDIRASGTELQYGDVLIYRNGIMIAQLPGTATMQYEYTDRGANGECAYRVRVMTGNGFYTQTEPVTIDATPETDGILLDDWTWIPLRYTKEFPRQYRITNREETYQRYYAGREYPVTVRSGRKSRIVNMEYIDKGHTICDRMEAISGAVVTYKTVVGDTIRGEINMVTANKGMIYSVVGFRLTECDHTEEVPYTAGMVTYNV